MLRLRGGSDQAPDPTPSLVPYNPRRSISGVFPTQNNNLDVTANAQLVPTNSDEVEELRVLIDIDLDGHVQVWTDRLLGDAFDNIEVEIEAESTDTGVTAVIRFNEKQEVAFGDPKGPFSCSPLN